MTTKEPGDIEGEIITDADGAPANQARSPGGLFSKGASGNPLGRPLGSHNKSTLLARSKFAENGSMPSRPSATFCCRFLQSAAISSKPCP